MKLISNHKGAIVKKTAAVTPANNTPIPFGELSIGQEYREHKGSEQLLCKATETSGRLLGAFATRFYTPNVYVYLAT